MLRKDHFTPGGYWWDDRIQLLSSLGLHSKKFHWCKLRESPFTPAKVCLGSYSISLVSWPPSGPWAPHQQWFSKSSLWTTSISISMAWALDRNINSHTSLQIHWGRNSGERPRNLYFHKLFSWFLWMPKLGTCGIVSKCITSHLENTRKYHRGIIMWWYRSYTK